MSILRAVSTATLAWALSGCAALHEPNEVAWQAMHVVDTLQTFHIASDQRYVEAESAWLIGEKPDDTMVLAWSVGLGVAHAGVTQLLMDWDHPNLAKVWQHLTLTSLCHTVKHNVSIGIRIGQPNDGPNNAWRPLSLNNSYPIEPGFR